MPSYTAPSQDMQFLLHQVLKVTETDIPGYEDLEADFTGPVLQEAGKLASEVLAPRSEEHTSELQSQVPSRMPSSA